jgi:protein gp37
MKNSSIQYTDDTFNPWQGCDKVSPGCDNCFACDADGRHLHSPESHWGKDAPRLIASDNYFKLPLAWNRLAEKAGIPRRVMCGTYCDIMERRDDLIAPRLRTFELVEQTPMLNWMFFTKRPQEYVKFLPKSWLTNPRHNVWLITTVESAE